MRYKGITGTINWSAENNCYSGKLQVVAYSIPYEGRNIRELKKDFRQAIKSVDWSCFSCINFTRDYNAKKCLRCKKYSLTSPHKKTKDNWQWRGESGGQTMRIRC